MKLENRLAGSIGNPHLDSDAAEFLDDLAKQMDHYVWLSSIPKEAGKIPGSVYSKQVIGLVYVPRLNEEVGKVQYVTLGHVAEHPHPEGEYYLVVKGNGILQLGEQQIDLAEGRFYHIPPNMEHALKGKLEILVFKFEPELVDSYRLGDNLRLERTIVSR